jgi:hypothetical protein
VSRRGSSLCRGFSFPAASCGDGEVESRCKYQRLEVLTDLQKDFAQDPHARKA